MIYLTIHVILGIIAYAVYYAIENDDNNFGDTVYVAGITILLGLLSFTVMISILLGKYLKSELTDQTKK